MAESPRTSVILTLRLIGAWAFVLIPLVWGVYKTTASALALFLK
jgi:hypothetical protein